jgi:hypothetical protein
MREQASSFVASSLLFAVRNRRNNFIPTYADVLKKRVQYSLMVFVMAMRNEKIPATKSNSN